MRRALLALALLAACSRGDDAARARVLSREDGARSKQGPFDPAHPEAALALDAGEAARRLGAAFDWTAAADWTVERSGADAQRVHLTEHHRLRQLPSDDFEVRADIDPGLGAGSESGKHVIHVAGTTYARALPAPFRERPTDHGRDARRFRDDSFGLAGTLARLYGPALRLEPDGEASVLGRRVRRYRLALAPGAAAAPAASAQPAGQPQPDPDTARRFAFLLGRVPTSADGELLADAETGVPLRVRLSGTFGVASAGDVKVTVELLAEVKAIGRGVDGVAPPPSPLRDERKPAGPSTALEAAGLKKRGEAPAEQPEATEDAD
jgi:hypothetical protein